MTEPTKIAVVGAAFSLLCANVAIQAQSWTIFLAAGLFALACLVALLTE